MGWAARNGALERTRLRGLRVAIDVQHLYREGRHARDRGSLYTLRNGTHITEADAVLVYAAGAAAWLQDRGAAVLCNDAKHGILTGPYQRRNQAASVWGAHAYLACHLNAGRGSYALLEYDRPLGESLAAALAHVLTEPEWPLILAAKTQHLAPLERGSVCIRFCGEALAPVLVEPFFGDTPSQQPMLAAPELMRLGATIGAGVGSWWERRAL